MTALPKLLETFRQASVTEREKSTYFEEPVLCYLRNEATYVVTVSLETMKIVNSLPALDIYGADAGSGA
ncbi:hypothetical protein NTGHW29_20048 [Candidatus Nitrotoga sp. HW29]|uniref:hypothetical protein n=1 Tax=Candidatus Nitrotoga sp. HW29 TaxID=2886963 RepID=UPI001EF1DC22|nr:hypothetical protein [Candidatus Nitrotoga sp. HW29]CAH1903993.1 hypothetical protein NTGHW29_20048 [Candidatus Nitrotoga sp. HW29]